MIRWLLCFIALTLSLEGADLHVLLAGDTLSDIKKATIKDLGRMRHFMRELAAKLHMHLSLTELTGHHLTSERLLQWPAQPVQPDDIILVFFTGHGFRTKASSSMWPYMYLPSPQQGFDLNILVQSVQSQEPIFALILADCCNNFRDLGIYDFMAKGSPTKRPHIAASSYRQLFLGVQGLVVASGSIPGKIAWASSNGGIFTAAFMRSLYEELTHNHPNWDRLLSRARTTCQSLQTPQYAVQVTPR